MSFPSTAYALINLNGVYEKVSFDMGHVDDSSMSDRTVKIYVDGELYDSYVVSGDSLPQNVEILLNGALQLKIETDASYGKTGFANIIAE